jgi:aminoglycoside phosphotransferase (APT) family kinase protein
MIVDTHHEAAALQRPPLLVRRPLEELLDARGCGSGPVHAEMIGEGHSNVTFAIERRGWRAVLRRPPRPPFHPGAHDVLREARILRLLEHTPARVPRVIFTCEDESVLGVPFYVMEELHGTVITSRLPESLDDEEGRAAVADELVDALVELHALDVTTPELARIGRPDGFLDRQLRTWGSIWSEHRTRDVPDIDEITRWLVGHQPQAPRRPAVVHGDYRLGNVMFAAGAPARLVGILDWEIATLGDPLCDVGWMLSTWPEPGDEAGTLLSMAGAVAEGGFPTRAELADRYAERSGRSVAEIGWYVVFAFWRAAIGLETLYKRALHGGSDDPFLHELSVGVPELAQRARLATAAALS